MKFKPLISLFGSHLAVDALFFKFIVVSWKTLCAISQSTYFAVSYSGSLDHMVNRITLSGECETYSRKVVVIYTSIAWVMVLVTVGFSMYSMFFTGGYMDIMLTPLTTHVDVSDLMIPRIIGYLISVYCAAAWVFPHTMSFMLATIFTRQYRMLSTILDRMLAESDECRLSDSDIEKLRQRHQEISMSVNDTDDFLMFHNAGAFCCQLINTILLLYDLIFFRATDNLVVIVMRAFWTFGVFFGLSVTAAGGIMVNHYVSMNGVLLILFFHISLLYN